MVTCQSMTTNSRSLQFSKFETHIQGARGRFPATYRLFPATHRLLRTKKGRKKTTPHSHPKKKKLAIARTAYGGPSNARRSGAHVWLTIRRPMLSTTFESIPHVGHKGLGSKSAPETHPKLLQSNQSLPPVCFARRGDGGRVACKRVSM